MNYRKTGRGVVVDARIYRYHGSTMDPDVDWFSFQADGDRGAGRFAEVQDREKAHAWLDGVLDSLNVAHDAEYE